MGMEMANFVRPVCVDATGRSSEVCEVSTGQASDILLNDFLETVGKCPVYSNFYMIYIRNGNSLQNRPVAACLRSSIKSLFLFQMTMTSSHSSSRTKASFDGISDMKSLLLSPLEHHGAQKKEEEEEEQATDRFLIRPSRNEKQNDATGNVSSLDLQLNRQEDLLNKVASWIVELSMVREDLERASVRSINSDQYLHFSLFYSDSFISLIHHLKINFPLPRLKIQLVWTLCS